jgi:hypothetical protein
MDYPFLAGKAICEEGLLNLEFHLRQEFSQPDKLLCLREFELAARIQGMA